MSETWKQWEGQVVRGEFPLLRFLGGSEACGVFLTHRREGQQIVNAAIKLISAAPENDDAQLSAWRQASELAHPHLTPLYEMGRCEIGGALLLYVVMECAEENLAQVLPARALTPAEAHAMLESVLDVLGYLHSKGLVHGHIKPANIMASGDELKVSSDGLRCTGESLDGRGDQDAYAPPEYGRGNIPGPQTLSPAGDVWSLGMTLVETLTQNLPVVRTAERQDPLIPQTLPEPFLDIARHCLIRHPQGRWTIAQISDRLEGRVPVSQAQTILPVPQPAARPSRPNVKRRNYGVPIAAGFVLLLAAVLAMPRLLRRNADAPQVPAGTSERPLVPPTPKQAAPSAQKPPAKSPKQSMAKEDRTPRARVPVPAVVHPGNTHEEETNTAARFSGGAPARGEVAHQVMPEVLQSARNTIRGTVKVRVKVNVDRSGNVEDAELASPTPSKYFARAAVEAAQLWKFNAPKFGNRGVLSSWTLQFDFTRDGTTVSPKQDLP